MPVHALRRTDVLTTDAARAAFLWEVLACDGSLYVHRAVSRAGLACTAWGARESSALLAASPRLLPARLR